MSRASLRPVPIILSLPCGEQRRQNPDAPMKCWEIIFSGLTAFGTLAVAALAIWGDYIRARLVPGRLAVEIYEKDGDTVGQPPNQIYYRHLRAVNRRPWRRPENCRVLLRAMSRRGPNGIFQPDAGASASSVYVDASGHHPATCCDIPRTNSRFWIHLPRSR